MQLNTSVIKYRYITTCYKLFSQYFTMYQTKAILLNKLDTIVSQLISAFKTRAGNVRNDNHLELILA